MKTRFLIPISEINGPLDLDMTINSGQTSQPAWIRDDDYFQEFLIIDNQPVLIRLSQEEFYGPLMIEIESEEEIILKPVVQEIKHIFDLDFDLPTFYDFLSQDHLLKPTIDFCRGLRLFRAPDIFECLISSICSANNSIVRWNSSIRLIREKWGPKAHFSPGTFHAFPTPQDILQVPEHDLEEREQCGGEKDIEACINNLKACGVGYRGKFMKDAARLVSEEMDIKELEKMVYDDAFNTLLEFPGIGPKVADCILLYGYGMGEAFPTDVWIKRIISYLYFDGKDVPVTKIREFGREQFGEYAGYTQLYLFHYARKSGLLDKLKPSKK